MPHRLEHNDSPLDVTEGTEIWWHNYLQEFDEKIFPIFQRRGYRHEAALLIWLQVRTISELQSLQDYLHAASDADDFDGGDDADPMC